MEYNTWRPRQASGNFCPVCSNSHFPFCPPPPPVQQYYRPLPPPPFSSDQFFPGPLPAPPDPSHIPYNHYAYHPPVSPYPPPTVYPSPRLWNSHPTIGGDYGNSNHEVDVEGGSHIGVKRLRVETLGDDARRLRLIRDHGVKGHSYNGGEHASLGNSSNSHVQQHSLGDRDKVTACSANAHGTDGLKMLDPPGRNHANLASDYASYPDTRQRFSSGNLDFNHNHVFHSNNSYKHLPNSVTYALSNQNPHMHLVMDSPGLNEQPSHLVSPIPSLSVEPSRYPFSSSTVSSKSGSSALFPVALDSGVSSHVSHGMTSGAIASASIHYPCKESTNSSVLRAKESRGLKIASTENVKSGTEELSSMHNSLERPRLIDASHILKHPYRANRPDYIVVILRGLPGSGKSYLAKILRDLEVENGGTAPRIHSMDEYFMTEIEKVEESEKASFSGTSRNKKPIKQKLMEYLYEPEMEEAYRSSMLKAFKKTLDEGAFPFVIVDDRNLRVADFAQFWATAKHSGYEAYLLEATYKDPASLLHGDTLEGNCIQEVDMDTEETNCSDGLAASEGTNNHHSVTPTEGDVSCSGAIKAEFVEGNAVEVVKELDDSKWSNILDDESADQTEAAVGSSRTIPVVTKPFGKQGKSVRWADQNGSIGFSIGAGKVAYVSLMIGPGSGYNYKSNPLPEEEKVSWRDVESRKQNVFQDQLRAERESFKEVFDKRRYHRVTIEDGL